jgi:hypothetical protein
MENYDIVVIDPPTYSRAITDVERGDPPPNPTAVAIVTAMTTIGELMHEQPTCCVVCDDGNEYVFAIGEAPGSYLCAIPEGSNAAACAGPICPNCSRLTDAAKREKVLASLKRSTPEGRERLPN